MFYTTQSSLFIIVPVTGIGNTQIVIYGNFSPARATSLTCSALTGFMARHLLKIKFVNLINLLVDKEIIPELLQENCTVDKLTETMGGALMNGVNLLGDIEFRQNIKEKQNGVLLIFAK